MSHDLESFTRRFEITFTGSLFLFRMYMTKTEGITVKKIYKFIKNVYTLFEERR